LARETGHGISQADFLKGQREHAWRFSRVTHPYVRGKRVSVYDKKITIGTDGNQFNYTVNARLGPPPKGERCRGLPWKTASGLVRPYAADAPENGKKPLRVPRAVLWKRD
jgi:hypothetical protein